MGGDVVGVGDECNARSRQGPEELVIGDGFVDFVAHQKRNVRSKAMLARHASTKREAIARLLPPAVGWISRRKAASNSDGPEAEIWDDQRQKAGLMNDGK